MILRIPARLLWPTLGVGACLAAGAVEAPVEIASVLRTYPRWDIFVPTNRAAMFTCAACISFAVAGLVMRPRARLGALFVGAAGIALFGLLYAVFIEVAIRRP